MYVNDLFISSLADEWAHNLFLESIVTFSVSLCYSVSTSVDTQLQFIPNWPKIHVHSSAWFGIHKFYFHAKINPTYLQTLHANKYIQKVCISKICWKHTSALQYLSKLHGSSKRTDRKVVRHLHLIPFIGRRT